MCGIAGVIGSHNHEEISKMVSKLRHRGPDHSKCWTSEQYEYPVSMGHTRLSIVDAEARSNQPMISTTGRYVFVFNGEIYNHNELRERLVSFGCMLRTESDTEVLLEGLLKEGERFLERCNGMWSFCLWDRVKEKAFLGRDRYGIKPLYYYLNNGVLRFASEMKALTATGIKVKPSQYEDIILLHPMSYESSSITPIEGIEKIPPGCIASFEDGVLKVSQWWETIDHVNPDTRCYLEQMEEWRYLFMDAVRLRVNGLDQVGVGLSGGLDSSSIAACISNISSYRPRDQVVTGLTSFCAVLPGSSLDEQALAAQCADLHGLQLEAVDVDASKSPEFLLAALAQVEDPYITMPLSHLLLYEAISKKGIKVTIDGHGADELLSGYGHITRATLDAKDISMVREILAIDESCRTGIYTKREKLRLKESVRYHSQKVALRLCNINGHAKMRFQLGFEKSKRLPHIDRRIKHLIESDAFAHLDILSQELYILFHITVLPTLLRCYDKYAMASGVEIRMPFLDWRLVSLAFGIPWQSKVGGGYTKRIHRDAMRGILHDDVRLRRMKIGWNAPIHEWLHGPMGDHVESILLSSNCDSRHKSVKAWEIFKSKNQPTYSDGEVLWAAIAKTLWHESLDHAIWQ